MRRQKSIEKCTSVQENYTNVQDSGDGWRMAIAHARKLIAETNDKDRVRKLEESIRFFEIRLEIGQPFPIAINHDSKRRKSTESHRP
jgi:cell fate (sporulation/competence/biofilm development) regulator YlbF (YheA/YmcA/DUF963 family)